MTETAHATAAEIRNRVGHPIVDADGHFMEFMPLVDDEIVTYLEETGGATLRDRYLSGRPKVMDTAVFADARGDPSIVNNWSAMPSWWGNPVADPLDRATAYLPQLMNERLGELGIDFMLIYPSWTLGFMDTQDDALRGPVCRATNRYFSHLFAGLRDRFEPAALIPMQTPEEAVAEINFAVQELGFKSVVLHGFAHRPVGTEDSGATRLDFFGLDSPYDYDPVWAACVANNVAPAFHSSLQSHHQGRSITNYVHNHINGIAGSHQVLCKSLFLGGVYRRFPELRIGFLEGGIAWAAALLADLIGHWDKRGSHAIGDLDPAKLNVPAVLELVEKYGTPDMVRNRDRISENLSRRPGRPAQLDEFARADITSIEDILEPFENRLFFGCEADDPLIGVGHGLKFGGREVALRPIIGSDVSHWDAPVMNLVIVEAYELLEHGLIGPEEFKEFTFSNPVRLHAGANPAFFDGTAVESQAREVLGTTKGAKA
jgi:predicted TIM-barrel fold metal-dependent hydrolase